MANRLIDAYSKQLYFRIDQKYFMLMEGFVGTALLGVLDSLLGMTDSLDGPL